ncbi:hypothetical protein [Metapseudomonas otitidis]|uniref:hypothetical protein n=1 Tax=Metapseudomonas otitidis TaxID=319939 RepID=UPI00209B3A26|nr:hypothetical protein [Pseudomonas otitidis]MCO7557488.1 hypothetical protein [Pseudomonas otitidis]
MVGSMFQRKLIERSIWAVWFFALCVPLIWLVIGAAAYWVREKFAPAEASGWAQALGGLLAVIVAIAVPAWQAYQARLMREQEERESKADDVNAVYSLVSHFQALLWRIINVVVSDNGARLLCSDGTLEKELRDAAAAIQAVQLNSFSGRMVFYLLKLRAAGAFFLHVAEHLDSRDKGRFIGNPFPALVQRAHNDLPKFEEMLGQLGDYEAALRWPK